MIESCLDYMIPPRPISIFQSYRPPRIANLIECMAIRFNSSPEHLARLVENIGDDIQNIPAQFQRTLQPFYGLALLRRCSAHCLASHRFRQSKMSLETLIFNCRRETSTRISLNLHLD